MDVISSLRTHLRLARVSNVPTVWSNVLCAFLLTVGLQGFEWTTFLGAVVSVSLLYTGGMYLNDWKDADFDREHRRERPIPAGEVSRPSVLWFAVVYFAIALAISVLLEPGAVLWTLGLIACITAYDINHKDNPLSPWVMAACRGLIYPWAAALTGQAPGAGLWLAAAAAYAFTLGLTTIARNPRWDFRWCPPFRRSPSTTTPTGERKSADIFLQLLLCACVLLPALIWGSRMGEGASGMGLLALALFLAWSAYSLSGWFRSPPRIGFTVGNLIAGFILVDLLAIGCAVPLTAFVPLLFLVLFIATLKIQRIISGT